MIIKLNNKIIFINKNYTNKSYYIWHNIKYNLESNKVYKYSKCNLTINRNINTLIIIKELIY